jgi:hypothetical protein
MPSTTPGVDTAAASISSITMNDTSNTIATLQFSENVYGDAAHSIVLDATSVTFTDTTHTSSIPSVSSVAQTLNTSSVAYTLTWSGPAPVTGDTIVATVVASKIFDRAGNPTAGGATGSGTAKSIGMVGAIQKAARSASSLLRSVGHWIQSSVIGDQSNSPAAAARTETAGAASIDGTSTSPPRTQFYQPVPAAESQASKAGPTTAVGTEAAATPHVADAAPQPTSIAPTRSGTTQSLPAVTGSAGAVVRVGAVPTDSGVLPAWWILGLGVLAAGLVAAAAWMALKFVGDRRK